MLSIVKRIIDWSGNYKKRMYLGFLFSFINGLFVASHVIFAAIGLEIVVQDLNGARQMKTSDIILVLILMIVSGFYNSSDSLYSFFNQFSSFFGSIWLGKLINFLAKILL